MCTCSAQNKDLYRRILASLLATIACFDALCTPVVQVKDGNKMRYRKQPPIPKTMADFVYAGIRKLDYFAAPAKTARVAEVLALQWIVEQESLGNSIGIRAEKSATPPDAESDSASNVRPLKKNP